VTEVTDSAEARMIRAQCEGRPHEARLPVDMHAHIAETIKAHPIVLFMKGSLSLPQCGFSAATVETLRRYNVPIHAVDVLSDPTLREAIKAFSDWPTIPQLYIGGGFVGGCDIVREMHATGELGEVISALHIDYTS
jgi:monothiol glutaredoxin